MIHAIGSAIVPAIGSLFTAWPVIIAGALLDGRLVQAYVDGFSDQSMAPLAQQAREVQATFDRLKNAIGTWETVRRGLTPATDALKSADAAHKDALDEAADARPASGWGKEEMYQEKMKVVYSTRRLARETRRDRQEELRRAHGTIRDLTEAYQQAKRVFERTLQRYYGESTQDELAIALARRIGMSERRVLTILKRRVRAPLTPEERKEIIELGMTGTPGRLLAVHYQIHEQHIYRILTSYRTALGDIERVATASPPS